MLRLPQGTPSRALRAELGILSIESIIAKRKLMYLHSLMNLPTSNITRKVLLEQLNLPGATWLQTTLELCKKLQISDDLEIISKTSKHKWKNMVEIGIVESEENELVAWTNKSKKYNSMTLNLKKKHYLKFLPPILAMTILKSRTGMIELKTNYKNKYLTTKCRKCNIEEEELKHVLLCNNTINHPEMELINQITEIINNLESETEEKIYKTASLIAREVQKLKSIETTNALSELCK